MTNRVAPPSYRILSPVANLLETGDGDSLQTINTFPLPDGAVCWVVASGASFRLFKQSVTPADNISIIAPSAGPGRWFIEVNSGSGMQIQDQAGLLFTQRPILETGGAHPIDTGVSIELRDGDIDVLAFGSLSAAAAAAATNTGQVLLLVNDTYAIDASVTDPSLTIKMKAGAALTAAANRTLDSGIDFSEGGIIRPANGVTVTINGPIVAEDTQHIFDISLGGAFRFGTGAIGRLSVRHFGANGLSGTDQHDEIQAFFDALVDASGVGSGVKGIVPPGQYRSDSQLTLSGLDGGTIQGYGIQNSRIFYGGVGAIAGGFVQIISCTNTILSELTIDGVDASLPSYACNVSACTNTRLLDCLVTTAKQTLRIGSDSESIYITRCEVTGGNGAAAHACGVFLQECNGVIIEACNIHDNGNPTGTEGGAPGPSGAQLLAEINTLSLNVRIHNNRITNADGNACFGILAFDVAGWVVTDNHVDEGNILGVGNNADSSGYGIAMYHGSSPLGRNVISNNVVQNCAGTGIYYQALGVPIQESVIHANHLVDTALQLNDTSLLVGGIGCNCARTIITDNVIRWTSYEVTADDVTNTLTLDSLNAINTFEDDDRVTIWNVSGALPGGLSSATSYYVINSTPTSLQLSLSSGGAAVNITSAGTGIQLIAATSVGSSGIQFQGNQTICKGNLIDGAWKRPAISMRAAGTFFNCDNSIIALNQILNSQGGIYSNTEVTIEGLIVSENKINPLLTGAAGIGVALQSISPRCKITGNTVTDAPADGIILLGGTNCLIANNLVQNCSLQTVAGYPGILNLASDSVIIGNLCNGDNHNYGIQDTGTYNVICLNNCKGHATPNPTGAVNADATSFQFANVVADNWALDNQVKNLNGTIELRDATGQNLGATWTYPGTLALDVSQTSGTLKLTALGTSQHCGIESENPYIKSTASPIRMIASGSNHQTVWEDDDSNLSLLLSAPHAGNCSMDTDASVPEYAHKHHGTPVWYVNNTGYVIQGLGSTSCVTTNGSGYITSIPYTDAATVSTIVARDAAGRFKAVDPSAASDVATKGYVDSHATFVFSGTTDIALEGANLSARRIVAIAQVSALTTTEMPANTGDRVQYVADATTVPTANPASGYIAYSSGGNPYRRHSDGTVD